MVLPGRPPAHAADAHCRRRRRSPGVSSGGGAPGRQPTRPRGGGGGGVGSAGSGSGGGGTPFPLLPLPPPLLPLFSCPTLPPLPPVVPAVVAEWIECPRRCPNGGVGGGRVATGAPMLLARSRRFAAAVPALASSCLPDSRPLWSREGSGVRRSALLAAPLPRGYKRCGGGRAMKGRLHTISPHAHTAPFPLSHSLYFSPLCPYPPFSPFLADRFPLPS